jgi:hypothetical protein
VSGFACGCFSGAFLHDDKAAMSENITNITANRQKHLLFNINLPFKLSYPILFSKQNSENFILW